MIITRSPLRISIGGGGTDLPSYYERHGGFLISAAINHYVYITLNRTFQQEIILKYSKLERVGSIAEVEHPIVREALRMTGIAETPFLEITSMADIPAGTGLGSSGSFTTALLRALHCHNKTFIEPGQLAAQACDIEINRLKEPIGKQDQYIAAYGGVTCFEFKADGTVVAAPLKLSEDTSYKLQDNLLLFYTGKSRTAGSILKDQNDKTKVDDGVMLANLHTIKELGLEIRRALEGDDLVRFAQLLDRHWQTKRKRSGTITDPAIDACYEYGIANGALGGKLIGAGGGGFLLFYAHDKSSLRRAMRDKGLKEVHWNFDYEGTKVVSSW